MLQLEDCLTSKDVCLQDLRSGSISQSWFSAYFDVSKPKYIEILTTIFRWISFTSMIILRGPALGEGKRKGHPLNSSHVFFSIIIKDGSCSSFIRRDSSSQDSGVYVSSLSLDVRHLQPGSQSSQLRSEFWRVCNCIRGMGVYSHWKHQHMFFLKE